MAPRLSRFERMTNLVLALLETERPLSLREIGAAVAGYPSEHGALRQAFERDKRSLRDAGIPVAVERIDGEDQVGYRIRPEEYYLPDLGLDEEETEALAFALAAVRLEGAGMGELARKLGASALDALPPIALLPSLPALGVLEQAVRDRSRVRFGYHDRRRDVAGYALVFSLGAWYLIGDDASAGGIRTFRVDRLESDVDTGEPAAYEIPASFDAGAELRSMPLRARDEVAAVDVELLLAPRALPGARQLFGADMVVARHDGGPVTLSLRVADEDALVSYVLGLGEDAVVVSPASLRERVLGALAAAATNGRSR